MSKCHARRGDVGHAATCMKIHVTVYFGIEQLLQLSFLIIMYPRMSIVS